MARYAFILLAVAVSACFVGAMAVQQSPGPQFPFYDNCRRNAAYSRWKLLGPAMDFPDSSTVRACFVVLVNASAPCPEETFTFKGKRFVSRCCNTNFAKIKFYVDATCRRQFVASALTVRNAGNLNKIVSPVWDPRPVNYTEVKYTQFGPVPQNVLNGTTFCLTLKKDTGPCNVATLLGINAPLNRQRKLFQVALYDRKVDGYECCPTYNFKL